MTTDNRTNEPNKYAGFLARQNHQRDPWRGIGVKCLCGKIFDLDADHAMHQVDEILRAALVAAQGAAPVPSSGVDEEKLAEVRKRLDEADASVAWTHGDEWSPKARKAHNDLRAAVAEWLKGQGNAARE